MGKLNLGRKDVVVDTLTTNNGKTINIEGLGITLEDFYLKTNNINKVDFNLDSDDFVNCFISINTNLAMTLVSKETAESIEEMTGINPNSEILSINKTIKKKQGDRYEIIDDNEKIKTQIKLALDRRDKECLQHYIEIFWVISLSKHSEEEAKEILFNVSEDEEGYKEAVTIHIVNPRELSSLALDVLIHYKINLLMK